jgi:peptidoglycan hydrolase-like protein with peptidoglycan-binding domain
MRRWVIPSLATAALVLPASSALADQPPEPGCKGQIVATINHELGTFGASGNPNASAGLGYFLGPDTAEAVRAFQETFCA